MSSQGPNSPDSGADDAGIGTIAWTNPGNVLASDDARAVATNIPLSALSHYLVATDYDFTIPAGATINGIVVQIERHGTSATGIKDNVVRLVKGGVISGDNTADTSTAWPNGTDGTATYGSSSDLWGLTWTADDINATNFGVAVVATNVDVSTRSARVDHITITVHYTETQTVAPTSIASAEAFGTPTIQPGEVVISPTAIATAEAFGTPTVTPGAVTISPTSIASAEAFGTPTVQIVQRYFRDNMIFVARRDNKVVVWGD